MTTTTLARNADDASLARTASTNLHTLIAAERGKAQPDRVWLAAAEDAAAAWGQRSAEANAAMLAGLAADGDSSTPGPLSWGRQFAASPQWRNRTGLTCDAAELLPGYVEERAAAAPLLPGAPTGAALSPIAARCGTIPAAPGAVHLIRWQGPLLPGAPQVPEELKQAAGEPPALQFVTAPYIGSWLPVRRQLLEDYTVVAGLVDGRLRRALGLSLDSELVDMAAADADVPAAASVLGAVGELSAAGYGGDLTVILAGADFATIGPVADLTALGVGAVLASAQVPEGTAIVGNLAAGIQIRTVGAARVMVTDSHAANFLENRLVILAEARTAFGVADPWAVRLVGAETETRTRGKRAA